MDELSAFAVIIFTVVMVAALASVDFASLITDEGSDIRVDPDSFLDLEVNVSSINWGELLPGGNSSRVVLLTNNGNVSCSLYLMAENWDPENASDVLSLSWNLEGETLGAGKSVAASFVLEAAALDLGNFDFSFGIVITGVAEI